MNIPPPHLPSQPPISVKKHNWSIVAVIAVIGLVIGSVVGAYVITRQTTLSSQASDSTVYWDHGEGQTMSFDGTRVTVHDSGHQYELKLVMYKANQPAWGPSWKATSGPVVSNVSDGSQVEVPCGYFQADLIPRNATVYDSPSYTGDRYGYPGADVLKAAVNGERTNCTQPTETPRPPTATPLPTNTPTPTPTNAPTPTPAPSMTPLPPTPTPTKTPPPCITPPAATNMKISCPVCASQ